MGAAVADLLFAITAGFGLTFIIDFIGAHKVFFRLIGGLIVIFLGIRIFLKSPIRQVRERNNGVNNLWRDFFSVLIIMLSNPIAIVLFIGVFAGLNLLRDGGYFFHSLVFAGIFCGAALWWFILSSFVNTYRHNFRLKNLWWLNKVTGVIIFIFGLVALFSILFA